MTYLEKLVIESCDLYFNCYILRLVLPLVTVFSFSQTSPSTFSPFSGNKILICDNILVDVYLFTTNCALSLFHLTLSEQ